MRRLAIAAAVLLLAHAALAVEPSEILADPVLEARARDLSAGLRCLVCQNQSIDDSEAPLARDLRVLLRERLVAGDTDAAATQFIVARYGDYVLLKPPFAARTILLWVTPFALLALAAAFLFRRRMRGSAQPDTPLTADEHKTLESLQQQL